MEQYWVGRARRLALRVNAGWVLDAILPLLIGWAVLASAALLWSRRADHAPTSALIVVTIPVVLAAGLRVAQLARRFFTTSDALARLDLSLGLHNRLVSAHAGVGEWPSPSEAPDGLRYKPPHVMGPIVFSVAMLVAASFVPVTRAPDAVHPTNEPVSWSDVDDTIDELAAEELADEEALEEWRERLEALREQPEENWFEHSSLEAGDHLEKQLDSAVQNLSEQLEAAAEMVEHFERVTSDEWKEALEDMQSGSLPPDAELMQKMASIDPKNAKQLSKEQMEALKRALAENASRAKKISGEDEARGKGQGVGEGKGEARDGDRPGQGGVTRGPGDAELTFRDRPADISTAVDENVASGDLERASIGDTVAVGQTEHEDDRTYRPGQGGAIANSGGGGEAVERTRYAPSEQAFLERWFK